MQQIQLREKLVAVLGLEECDKMERFHIINDLTQLAVEKTMDDLLSAMKPEELEDLQQYITKDPGDLPEICRKHQKSLENFFIIFNKNLDAETIEVISNITDGKGEDERPSSIKKHFAEREKNALLNIREENEESQREGGISFKKVVGVGVLSRAMLFKHATMEAGRSVNQINEAFKNPARSIAYILLNDMVEDIDLKSRWKQETGVGK